jgi:hypothetical protein
MQFQVTTVQTLPSDPPGSGTLRIDFDRPTSEQGAEDRRDVLTEIFRVPRRDVIAPSTQTFLVVIRP